MEMRPVEMGLESHLGGLMLPCVSSYITVSLFNLDFGRWFALHFCVLLLQLVAALLCGQSERGCCSCALAVHLVVWFNCRPVVVVFERYLNHRTCSEQDPQCLWCSTWAGSSPGAGNSSGWWWCGLEQAAACGGVPCFWHAGWRRAALLSFTTASMASPCLTEEALTVAERKFGNCLYFLMGF